MPKSQSPKQAREDVENRYRMIRQQKLDDIAATIDMDALPDKPVIPIDNYGNVDIHPSHPDYEYLLEDDV
ncbi:hypothetical protein LF817_16470 [Halobacillus sp. A1]|uniref:hypothetical protein n=1 Tax=Halobacillus sp. A1 TaxID=2880262 RepID=UPI0020A63E45|nr:hypothetical protein [Halobacillus sp. A1]MCP3032921.1 hypothetical protein [Halobacillus sp. A1]